jgi:hypothetical protein
MQYPRADHRKTVRIEPIDADRGAHYLRAIQAVNTKNGLIIVAVTVSH